MCKTGIIIRSWDNRFTTAYFCFRCPLCTKQPKETER